jgi:flagellar biosynthesis anti-sigma factor FlgM
MAINRIDTYTTQAPQRTAEQNGRPVADDKTIPVKDATVESDSVKLSRSYQEMAQVKKVMTDQEEMRMDRVNHLRESVAAGAYSVQPERVAERMLQDMW